MQYPISQLKEGALLRIVASAHLMKLKSEIKR